jgi:hypothetical protein
MTESGNDDGQLEKANHEKNDPEIEVGTMMEKFQMFAMKQMGGARSMDLSKLNDEHITKALDLAMKREDSASKYFSDKLKSKEVIKLAQIKADSHSAIHINYKLICVTVILLTITLLVFFKAEGYISQWMSLMMGALGGYGYGTSVSAQGKVDKKKKEKQAEEEQE